VRHPSELSTGQRDEGFDVDAVWDDSWSETSSYEADERDVNLGYVPESSLVK